jgi:CHAT domain-containing protein
VALTGADATRARLLALPELREAGLLHLATHGVANENEPGRSGLWLAPDAVPAGTAAVPGFLAVDDIMGLGLRSELVTLSACETGLGRLERGEGVLGLTRAFLVAGARSVVVSLWRVNDRSTALLMDGFYQGLLRRGLAREEALAEAKRTLLSASETRSPYYWAPFVMVGEGGKLR